MPNSEQSEAAVTAEQSLLEDRPDNHPRPDRRSTLAIVFGTTIEWYDFFLYGWAATLVFPHLFFPSTNPTVATLLSLATFGTAFVARPVGAIVFGQVGDRHGRKAVLVVTLILMGVGTTGIGLLPTYDQLGLAAPLILVVLRIVQGFATGGEWGGAALMLRENRSSRPGLAGSMLTVAQSAGSIASIAMFTVLSEVLLEEAFLDWGWRIPFLVSLALVMVAMWMRRSLGETEEFERLRKTSGQNPDMASRSAVREILRSPRNLVAIFFVRIGQNVTGYTVLVFSLTYATTVLGMTGTPALTALVISQIGALLLAPLWGYLGDRFGDKRVMIAVFVGQVLYGFPLFLLVDTRNTALIVVAVFTGVVFLTSAAEAVQPTYFTSMFGTSTRLSGAGIGREAGTVIGGGLTPFIALTLVTWSGSSWPVSTYMVATSVIALFAVLAARPVRPAAAPHEIR